MNTEINIWDNLNLTPDNLKTAYHYLTSQTENFNKAVKGELKMEIEVRNINDFETDGKYTNVTLYILYLIAPQLGNFRKRILSISEYEYRGRFPVAIYNHISEENLIDNISEEKLLESIKESLGNYKVKNVIENLYRQSIEARKNKISV